MKKNQKSFINHCRSFLCLILCMMMSLSLFVMPERARAAVSDGNTVTGNLNENVYWTYYRDTQKVVISGEGEMYEDPDVENYSPFNPYSDVYEDGYNEDVEEMLMYTNEIVIEDGITSIMDRAFRQFAEVREIHIGAGVEKIGANAFRCGYSGSLLKSITVDPANKAFIAKDGGLYTKAMTKLIRCYINYDEDRVFKIPSGVKAIAQGAFFSCTLKKIVMPTTLTKIASYAFECAAIDSIVVPHSVKELNHTFDGMWSVGKIYVGSSIKKVNGAFDNIYNAKIYFAGDLPTGMNLSKLGDDTVIYYPKNNKTWTLKSTSKVTLKPWAFYTPAISSLANNAAAKLTVKWSVRSAAKGYQIQYAANSKFTGAKTVTVKDVSTIQKTIGSLTKGTTYYVRMRAYKKVNATNLYSDWSIVKKLKLSK